MRSGIRFGLSAIEKRDLWSRWKAGQSLHAIGVRLISRIAVFVRCCCLAVAFLPLARRRSRLALTLAEREDISRGIASGASTS